MTRRTPLGLLVAVALLSAAGLAWEVTLTRLASVLLAYHFAFVAVSLAVSGLGLGAALVYALPSRASRMVAVWGSMASALLFLLTALLLPTVADGGVLVALLGLALLPFLGLGLVFAAIFRLQGGNAPLVYGADLVGAGLGAGGVIAGLDLVNPFGMLFVLGAVAAVAALLLRLALRHSGLAPTSHSRSAGGVAGVLVLLLLVGLIVQIVGAPLQIDYAQLRNAPPDKTIVSVLRDPTQHARTIETRWDAFARTDVVATSYPSQRLVFTDGGAGTYMNAWDGDRTSPSAIPLLNDLETTPLLLGSSKSLGNVLVIGAGGGIDVLRALVAGARHVTAVELNAATVAAVRAEGAYNGHILDRPDVTTVVDDGRHFLAQTHAHYDAIMLNLVYSGATQGQGNALSESYIFTTQAFQSYLAHLAPSGRIDIIGHQGLEGLRAFTTGLAALHQNGLSYPQALRRAALVLTNNNTPEARPSLMILQNDPLTRAEANRLQSRVDGLGLQRLWLPFHFVGAFDAMAAGTQTLDTFLQGSPYAIGPTEDDRPFFFDFNFGLPEGLNAALWYALALAIGLVVVVFFARESPEERPESRREEDRGNVFATSTDSGPRPRAAIWTLGGSMALLGIGFMCAEVSLIQRAILLLGSPVLALIVVLASLLLGGGIGSLAVGALASRIDYRRLLPVAALIVATLIGVETLLLPIVQGGILSMGVVGASCCTALLLAPLGLALGAPFPLTLRLSADTLPGDVALFWSLNALFSVLGSVLAAVVAVVAGFNAVLGLGALCYILVAVVLSFSLSLARGRVRTQAGRRIEQAAGRRAAPV